MATASTMTMAVRRAVFLAAGPDGLAQLGDGLSEEADRADPPHSAGRDRRRSSGRCPGHCRLPHFAVNLVAAANGYSTSAIPCGWCGCAGS